MSFATTSIDRQATFESQISNINTIVHLRFSLPLYIQRAGRERERVLESFPRYTLTSSFTRRSIDHQLQCATYWLVSVDNRYAISFPSSCFTFENVVRIACRTRPDSFPTSETGKSNFKGRKIEDFGNRQESVPLTL